MYKFILSVACLSLLSCILLVSGCDDSSSGTVNVTLDNSDGIFPIPDILQASNLPSNKMQAWITINDDPNRIEMILDEMTGSMSVTIPDLVIGQTYNFLVEFEFASEQYGVVLLADASQKLTLVAGGNHLEFTDEHYTLANSDGDDFTNLQELVAGTNPTVDNFYITGNAPIAGRDVFITDGTQSGTRLIRDSNGSYSSNPGSAHIINGIIYFSANDGINGMELWKSNGSETGTVMVKDINPSGDSNPSHFTEVSGMLYFTATDGGYGIELWKSDGSEAGTVMVKDINSSGNSISIPSELLRVRQRIGGDILFFTATDGVNGLELWKSDGTNTGTVLVKDINPNVGVGSYISGLAAMDGILYFEGDDGTNGRELWRSDGTQAGTTLLKDTNPNIGASGNPYYLTAIGNTLFFVANSGELWVSDGTTSGTVMIKQLSIRYNSRYNVLENVGGMLFFAAGDISTDIELWKSDGTTAGTVLVKNINPAIGAGSNPDQLTNVDGTLFFTADGGSSGVEVWKSDGTESGTVMLKDINIASGIGSGPINLTSVAGTLFFAASDTLERDERELWKSNGTEASTVRVKDILPGIRGSDPGNLSVITDLVYFTANDGVNGRELWRSDGTQAGTHMIKDINTSGTNSYSPSDLVTMNGISYFLTYVGFNTNDTLNNMLWRTDNTSEGTYNLSDQVFDVGPPGFMNSNLYFFARDSLGFEIWKSDGTQTGTQLLKDINPGRADSVLNMKYTSIPTPITAGNLVYFPASDGLTGKELWVSDGTPNGTRLVKDINFGLYSSNPDKMLAITDTLFFTADDGTHGTELWKSDGTETGTVMVKDINTSSVIGSNPQKFANVDGVLFFSADDGSNGYALWKTDGTESGTIKVRDIDPLPVRYVVSDFTSVSGTLYFSADDGINGAELWKSDGTESGTVMVKNINFASGSSWPSGITENSTTPGQFFFIANDGVNGEELWKSDGTESGTVMVKDVNFTVGASSYIQDLTMKSGTLYFTADDGINGRELWKSDGTSSGTVLAVELNPGTSSSNMSILGVPSPPVFGP